MLLRARVVLPISRPPIADGAVLISGRRVAAVGRWRDLGKTAKGPGIDLGPVILMPGLVNAHCHLDYTDMWGQPPPKRFPDWIKGILARKAAAGYGDYAQAWLRGAAMLVRHGVTTVADIEAVPELLPDVWSSTPLRVISFLELTGVRSRRDPAEILREAEVKIDSLKDKRSSAALSPHAIYSTTPELLRGAAGLSGKRGWPVTMHVAESIDEFDMCLYRRGVLREWLEGQRDLSDCGGASPVQIVERSGLLNERFLAVHVNYLRAGDAEILARAHASVVHCPRSHAYFGHKPFPRRELLAAGVNLCLGTDSLASAFSAKPPGPELNLFAEMQAFSQAHHSAGPSEILRLATIHGARALGREGKAGEISENALADLITIPYAGRIETAESAVVRHGGGVAASMIDGQWVIAPPEHSAPSRK